jgi:LacI family transcriptional regulator
LILGTSVADEQLARLFRERRIPHVSVDPIAENLGLNTVCAHSMIGIRQAIIHLKELGHENIGFVVQQEAVRYPQYVAAMVEQGLTFCEDLNCEVSNPTDHLNDNTDGWKRRANKAFRLHLEQNRKLATAFICSNDAIAFGVMQAIKDKDLEPGKDISVIGYDNIDVRGITPANSPILTTVDNPRDRIGERCGELLLNQVLHQQMEIVHERLPTRLIVRETTGPCKQ